MNPKEGYRGFAKLPRYIMAYDLFCNDHNTIIVYIYLLMSANHEPGTWNDMPYDAGQFYTSYNTIAEETGLTVEQVRRSIRILKSIPLPEGDKLSIFHSQNCMQINTSEHREKHRQNNRENNRLNNREKHRLENAIIFTSPMPNCLLITVNNYDCENYKKENFKKNSQTFSQADSHTYSQGKTQAFSQQYYNSYNNKNRASEKQLAIENEEDNFEDACNIDDGFGACAFDGAAPSQTTKQNGQSGNDSSGNQKNGNYNGSSNKRDYYVPKSTDEIPWNVYFYVYHIHGENACKTDKWTKPMILKKFGDDSKMACEFYARLVDGVEHPENYKDVAVSRDYFTEGTEEDGKSY